MAAPKENHMSKSELLDYALMTLGVPLIAALGYALRLGVKWLAAKTQTTVDDAVLPKLADLAMVAVKSTYQTYVKPLKDTPGWTEAAHAQAQSLALAELKSYLGAKGFKELAQAFGGDLERVLGGFIETAVHDNKRAGDAVANVAAVLP